MILKAFAVYDVKSCTFSPPFFVTEPGVAIRNFSDVCNDPNSMIFRHPEDFDLYMLGEFDDFKGEFDNIKPVNLGKATNFVKSMPHKTIVEASSGKNEKKKELVS